MKHKIIMSLILIMLFFGHVYGQAALANEGTVPEPIRPASPAHYTVFLPMIGG